MIAVFHTLVFDVSLVYQRPCAKKATLCHSKTELNFSFKFPSDRGQKLVCRLRLPTPLLFPLWHLRRAGSSWLLVVDPFIHCLRLASFPILQALRAPGCLCGNGLPLGAGTWQTCLDPAARHSFCPRSGSMQGTRGLLASLGAAAGVLS